MTRTKVIVSAVLCFVLAGCGLHTQPVEPRQPDYINTPQAPVVVKEVRPSPSYYRVYVDENSNVICVDTDLDLNFFEC